MFTWLLQEPVERERYPTKTKDDTKEFNQKTNTFVWVSKIGWSNRWGLFYHGQNVTNVVLRPTKELPYWMWNRGRDSISDTCPSSLCGSIFNPWRFSFFLFDNQPTFCWLQVRLPIQFGPLSPVLHTISGLRTIVNIQGTNRTENMGPCTLSSVPTTTRFFLSTSPFLSLHNTNTFFVEVY